MATTNTYTNAKAVLRGNTTVYTVPSAGTSIFKSIRVSNTEENTDRDITLIVTDGDSVVYYLEVRLITGRGINDGIRRTENE